MIKSLTVPYVEAFSMEEANVKINEILNVSLENIDISSLSAEDQNEFITACVPAVGLMDDRFANVFPSTLVVAGVEWCKGKISTGKTIFLLKSSEEKLTEDSKAIAISNMVKFLNLMIEKLPAPLKGLKWSDGCAYAGKPEFNAAQINAIAEGKSVIEVFLLGDSVAELMDKKLETEIFPFTKQSFSFGSPKSILKKDDEIENPIPTREIDGEPERASVPKDVGIIDPFSPGFCVWGEKQIYSKGLFDSLVKQRKEAKSAIVESLMEKYEEAQEKALRGEIPSLQEFVTSMNSESMSTNQTTASEELEFRNITILARVKPAMKDDEVFLELFSELLGDSARNCVVKRSELNRQSVVATVMDFDKEAAIRNYNKFLKVSKESISYDEAFHVLRFGKLGVKRKSWVDRNLPLKVISDLEYKTDPIEFFDTHPKMKLVFNEDVTTAIEWIPSEEDKAATDWFVM